MELADAEKYATRLMKKHRLLESGWVFKFDRAKHRLGLCDSRKRVISISRYFTGAANEDQFEQAMLHEIAHALLPSSAKHGPLWKHKAREIGYRGSRLAYNPYSKHLEKQDADKFDVMVASIQSASYKPTAGDKLTLPNGVELEVLEVNGSRTKAVEIGGTQVWSLVSASVHNFVKK